MKIFLIQLLQVGLGRLLDPQGIGCHLIDISIPHLTKLASQPLVLLFQGQRIQPGCRQFLKDEFLVLFNSVQPFRKRHAYSISSFSIAFSMHSPVMMAASVDGTSPGSKGFSSKRGACGAVLAGWASPPLAALSPLHFLLHSYP